MKLKDSSLLAFFREYEGLGHSIAFLVSFSTCAMAQTPHRQEGMGYAAHNKMETVRIAKKPVAGTSCRRSNGF